MADKCQNYYKEVKSNSSSIIQDISGFVFGGITSRFWGMRKHINSISGKELDKLPFYCWECVSLEGKLRNVDLIIQEQDKMDMFLKFLIYQLKTYNGVTGSSEALLATKFPQDFNKLK